MPCESCYAFLNPPPPPTGLTGRPRAYHSAEVIDNCPEHFSADVQRIYSTLTSNESSIFANPYELGGRSFHPKRVTQYHHHDPSGQMLTSNYASISMTSLSAVHSSSLTQPVPPQARSHHQAPPEFQTHLHPNLTPRTGPATAPPSPTEPSRPP